MNNKLLAGFLAGAVATGVVVAALVGSGAEADRIDTWRSASARVVDARLSLLPDGGCRIIALGEASKLDGGVMESTIARELSGAPQTRCLGILDDAKTLWRQTEGL